MNDIEKIFILGGTHGNEYTGAYIVKNWNAINSTCNYSIPIVPLLSNPKAFHKKLRYIDIDLNRSFSRKSLNNQQTLLYEEDRAKVLYSLISDKRNKKNFIIDVHTTNSNMGITIATSTKDIYKLNLINHISKSVGKVNVIYSDDIKEDRPFLNSASENSLLIEIGGVANNLLNHVVFNKAVKVIIATIDFLHKIKTTTTLNKNIKIPAFYTVKKIGFPRDGEGNLIGMIHKDIQDNDYLKKISCNTNIFKLFNGESVKLGETEEYYMSFINESAYYEDDIAFYLMKKLVLSVDN